MNNTENEEKQGEYDDSLFEFDKQPEVAVEGETVNELPPQSNEKKPKILVKSLVCSIIYSLLLIIVSAVIYSLGETSVMGLILAILLSVAFGVVMYIGGFYLIILPLPIFNLGFYGCLRRNDPIGKKILLAILDVALVALVFVVLFMLR